MINKELKDIYLAATGNFFSEAIGDNKVDNLVDELKRATEIELAMFVASQLNSGVQAFQQQYTTPQFDGFKVILKSLVDRYRVMDDAEKLDFFQKIEIFFKDLMQKNYSALGPEAAELVASRYAKQMMDWLKKQNLDPQAPTDTLYPHKRELAPKVDVVQITVPVDTTTPAIVQNVNKAKERDSNVGQLIVNPY